MRIPILMYHSISQTHTIKFRPFTVSPAAFAEQMAYLHDQGYTPITVTHFIQSCTHSGAVLPERPVIVTFDDGFADFFTNALPVLQRYTFTATLYVSTSFIGGVSSWLRNEGETTRPMLTKKQLQELYAYGIECGGHTHCHPQLDTLPRPQARNEIMQCKEILEQLLGKAVQSFAYPFGYYTAEIQNYVRAAGYTSACAVKHGMSTGESDPFALPRLMVTPDISIAEFGRLLNGTGLSTTQMLYLHVRTPVWSVVRRSSAFVTRYLQGGGVVR